MVEGEREHPQRPDPRPGQYGHSELNPVPPKWFDRPLVTSTLSYTPVLTNIDPLIHGEPAILAACAFPSWDLCA